MKRPLTIEIHGTGTHNRGAELMAIAILQHCREAFPGVRMVVQPPFGTFQDRARHGVEITWQFPGPRWTTLRELYVRFAPRMLRETAGIISPAEVDVVLDASGFAFGDRWGSQYADRLFRKMNSRGRREQPLILLSQAFGPFEKPEVKRSAVRLLERANLVCARDKTSHKMLEGLVDPKKLKLFPDFTALVSPVAPPEELVQGPFAAVCPNHKMLEGNDGGEAFWNLLKKIVERIVTAGIPPVFVLHEARKDREFVALAGERGIKIPVVEHRDPRVLKWVLGKSLFVVGSRFHALVSSLCQGVPCLGLGWSHKYPELFDDYDCGDLIQADYSDTKGLDERMTRLIDPNTRSSIRERIEARAAGIRQQIDGMWREVDQIIRSVGR